MVEFMVALGEEKVEGEARLMRQGTWSSQETSSTAGKGGCSGTME
jgi:hypothetical protein